MNNRYHANFSASSIMIHYERNSVIKNQIKYRLSPLTASGNNIDILADGVILSRQ